MDGGLGQTGSPGAPSFTLKVTPRDYRIRAIVLLTVGTVCLTVSILTVVTSDRSWINPLYPIAGLIYGFYSLRQARRQVTHTTLTIDGAGIRTPDGTYQQTWSGVKLVWVGSLYGIGLPISFQPGLSVFTNAGLNFARRAGTNVSPRLTLPIGGHHHVTRLCEQLRPIIPVPVIDGSITSRRQAAKDLANELRKTDR